MKHNPPSLPTRPPGPPLREPARRRVRGAAAAAALALHLAVFTVGAVAATVAWDVVLATSVAYARDGGGEGEGGGDGGGGDDGGGDDGGGDDGGGDDGGGDDGGGDNSGRGGDDGGNSGRGGDDGGNSGRGGDDGPGDDSGGRGRGRGSDDGRTDKGKNRTVVDRFLDTLSGRGRVVWSSARGNTIEVRYSDGWSERVGKDGYALLDPRRNVIVRRPAKPTDFQRLRAAAAR
jgi:hypothetical protein